MVSAQSNTEWITITDTSELRPGDIIEGPIKWAPILKHYGVIVYIDNKTYVVQHSGKKFEIITIEESLRYKPIERVLRTGVRSEVILQRAEQCKNMPYAFLFINCEDVVVALTHQSPGIDQRRFVATLLLIVILLILFFILRKQ